MLSRILTVVLTAVGLGLLALATLAYFRPWKEGPGLVVEEPHRVLTDLVPGLSSDVEFCLENRTGHPIRIVGADGP